MHFDYEELKSTLAETSKDDAGQSLIESEQEVYNFDKITEEVAKEYRNSKPYCSCDALYVKSNEDIYLLEFKNAKSSRIPKKSLREKAYDSIMTLLFAFFPEYSLEELRNKVSLVFVYNNEKDSECVSNSDAIQKMKEKMKQLAGANDSNIILFGLDIYKDILYKEIYTKDKTEFMNELYGDLFEEKSGSMCR